MSDLSTRHVAIALARQGDAVTVVASRRGGEPPCVQGVIITVAGADIATTPPPWELSTGEPNRCRTSFVYGQVPPGYAQSGSAPPACRKPLHGRDTGPGV